MNYVTIDVETANADNASICQIGMAKYYNGRLIDVFDTYVNYEGTFSQKNVNIHNIEYEDVKDAPSIYDLYGRIIQFVGVLPIVSHTKFDNKAINSCFESSHLPIPDWTWVDSSEMVRKTCSKWKNKGYGLANICQEWGYEFKHHNALEDAKACGFIVKTILREQGQSISDWISDSNQKKIDKRYMPRIRSKKGCSEGRFTGKSICFTGELNMSRTEITDLASKHGFDVKSGVSKKLDYLVVGTQDLSLLAGHNKSSKHRKAEEIIRDGIDIEIITEKQLIKMLSL